MQQVTLDIQRVRAARGWFIALGIVLVILGAIAIVYPAATSVTIAKLLGILLVVGAVVQAVHGIASREWKGFLLHMGVAAVYLVAGLILLSYTFGTILTVTLLLGIYLFVAGLFKVVNSFVSWAGGVSGWMLFSGLVDFLLGALIWASWPSSSTFVLGLLVGIDLLLSGWTMLMLGATAGMMTPEEKEIAAHEAEEKHMMPPKAA